jgi:SAM-dependent methyltransferase
MKLSKPGTGFSSGKCQYSKEELSLIPQVALDLSRACGNPTGFADLEEGEVVVDFGCGGGLDVILAAHKVGPEGKVIGVDLAPHMIERAKQAVADAKLTDRKIELVLDDIEKLKLPDNFADVVMSNCVITLCPRKNDVYQEAYRILKPGGRLAISDLVMKEGIDPEIMDRLRSVWQGGVGGSALLETYLEIVEKAGFEKITIVTRDILTLEEIKSVAFCPGKEYTPEAVEEDIEALQGKLLSIKFTAVKPTL